MSPPMSETENLFNQAMLLIAARPGAVFLGQGTVYDCHAMWASLHGIPLTQRIELPVAEELQMGMGVGLALTGSLPVLIYPRLNFLLRAMDQLVSHLDRLPVLSRGQFRPRVIIRTRVGSTTPLDAGPQHTGDFTDALRLMLKYVQVRKITQAEEIVPTYRQAIEERRSSLIVEALEQ